jgi:hypothetical protein
MRAAWLVVGKTVNKKCLVNETCTLLRTR